MSGPYKKNGYMPLLQDSVLLEDVELIIGNPIGGESLIWVGYPSLGQLLAPKRIELESPARSQIEDNVMGFPTVIYFLIFRHSCGTKLADPN